MSVHLHEEYTPSTRSYCSIQVLSENFIAGEVKNVDCCHGCRWVFAGVDLPVLGPQKNAIIGALAAAHMSYYGTIVTLRLSAASGPRDYTQLLTIDDGSKCLLCENPLTMSLTGRVEASGMTECSVQLLGENLLGPVVKKSVCFACKWALLGCHLVDREKIARIENRFAHGGVRVKDISILVSMRQVNTRINANANMITNAVNSSNAHLHISQHASSPVPVVVATHNKVSLPTPPQVVHRNVYVDRFVDRIVVVDPRQTCSKANCTRKVGHGRRTLCDEHGR